MIGTFEAIYNRDIVTPFFRNANMKTPAPLVVTGGYAHNRYQDMVSADRSI